MGVRRGKGGSLRHGQGQGLGTGLSLRQRRLTGIILILYSIALLYWMFIGFGRSFNMGGPLQYNLVPLETIRLFLDLDNRLPLSDRLVNLAGNVVVFMPFGYLIPTLKTRLNSLPALALYTVPCILLLEILQMLLHAGSFDTDDVLLNVLGVWAGCGLLRLTGMINRKKEN